MSSPLRQLVCWSMLIYSSLVWRSGLRSAFWDCNYILRRAKTIEDKELQSWATCKLEKCTKKYQVCIWWTTGTPIHGQRSWDGFWPEGTCNKNVYIVCYVSCRFYRGVENPQKFAMTIIQAYVDNAMGNLLTVKEFKDNSRKIFSHWVYFLNIMIKISSLNKRSSDPNQYMYH